MAPWTGIPNTFGREPPRFRYPRWRSSGTGAEPTPPTASVTVAPVSEPTGPAGGDLEGSTYPAPIVAPEKITLGKLAAAVAAKLLGVENVGTGNLAGEAVTLAKLAAAVAAKLLGAENVLTANLAGESVTLAKLAAAVQARLTSEPAYSAVEALNASLEAPGAPWSTVTVSAPDQFGLVHLRGALKVKAEILAKGILFTLPAASRPANSRAAVIAGAGGNTQLNVIIKANGEVEVQAAVKLAASPIAFDQVTFAAAG